MMAWKEMMNIFILFFYLICIANTYKYTLDNSKDEFDKFKQKYNKVYGNNSEELEHFNIFVSNLNDIEKLNENSTNGTLIMNKYADMDPAEVEEHYAVQIKPYDKVENVTSDDKNEKAMENDNLSELYDLDNSEQLYKEYLKKYKEKKYGNKFERLKHYYRFIKTLVAMNREKQQGTERVTQLDQFADQLQEPLEYMY